MLLRSTRALGLIETLESRQLLAATLPVQWLNPAASPVETEAQTNGSGAIHTPTTAAQFTTALNTAQLGDTIILQAGVTYTGTFTLPNKTTGSGWITIKSSNLESLPVEGVRVLPSDAANMPRIQAPGFNAQVIKTNASAHHFKFIGIEIVGPANNTDLVTLVEIGTTTTAQSTEAVIPHHINFDRCYFHPNTPSARIRRAFGLHGAHVDIVNSYIEEIHEGSDSNAIAGWNGTGPYNIINNRLEGAGENIMFGGATNRIPGKVSSDIVIKNNHIIKPLHWRGVWTVKNLFELKQGARILLEGNLIENNWTSGQTGVAIVLKLGDYAGSTQNVTEDVTLRNNIIRHSNGGVALQGRDYASNSPDGLVRRLDFINNVFDDINGKWGTSGTGGGTFFLYMTHGPKDVTFDHNTMFNGYSPIEVDANSATYPNTNFVYKNNIVAHNTYGIRSTQGTGNPTINAYLPDSVLTKNILMGGKASNYTSRPGNYFPATWDDVGFVDRLGGNYRLAASSIYNDVGTDGKDLGADIDALELALNVPKSNPGTPASVNEGSSLPLNGGASTGQRLTYEWDLNYDGVTFDVDATGRTPSFSALTIDGLATRTIALRTNDVNTFQSIKTGVITINNVAPTATFTAGAAVTQGSPSSVSFSGQFDLASADVSAGFLYSYDFNNDGDFTDPGDIANSTAASASFTYASSGTFNVRGRIADNDGGFTDYVKAVTVNPSGPGTPVDVTLNPSADAYVRDGSSNNTNFGVTTVLEVKKDATSYNREIYLKFDLNSLSGIVSAKVRVFGKLSSSGAGINVALYPVGDSTWGENTIKFNNKPAAGGTALGQVMLSSTTGQYFEFDVTDYVKAQKLAGASFASFNLKALSGGTGMPVFNSRENGANKPQLQVSQGAPTQSLVVSTANVSVPEGASTQFTVKLAAQPASDVTVNISKNGGGDADLNATVATLTFTSVNWNTAQNVTVSAAQDGDSTNGSAVFTVSASGLSSKTVTATEADDEAAQTLLATNDAYVRDGSYANSNFGNDTQLVVKKDSTGNTRESHIKFDISSVGTISGAKLRLFGKLNDVYASGLVAAVFGAAGGTWAEGSVTYNTRPAPITGQLASATVLGTAGTWYEFDITGFLQTQKAAGATSVTFIVRAATSGPTLKTFNSRQSASNGPQLVVTA